MWDLARRDDLYESAEKKFTDNRISEIMKDPYISYDVRWYIDYLKAKSSRRGETILFLWILVVVLMITTVSGWLIL